MPFSNTTLDDCMLDGVGGCREGAGRAKGPWQACLGTGGASTVHVLCTCTVEAVLGSHQSREAEGQGYIRGWLSSQGSLRRVGYLVYSAGLCICTVSFAKSVNLLRSGINFDDCMLDAVGGCSERAG